MANARQKSLTLKLDVLPKLDTCNSTKGLIWKATKLNRKLALKQHFTFLIMSACGDGDGAYIYIYTYQL